MYIISNFFAIVSNTDINILMNLPFLFILFLQYSLGVEFMGKDMVLFSL